MEHNRFMKHTFFNIENRTCVSRCKTSLYVGQNTKVFSNTEFEKDVETFPDIHYPKNPNFKKESEKFSAISDNINYFFSSFSFFQYFLVFVLFPVKGEVQ